MSTQPPPDNGATNPESPSTTDAVAINNNNAAQTKKQPPPEKPSDIRRRTHIILSFWLIVLCLGLPIWWKTTTIYRADLPLQEMLDWSDGKVCADIASLRQQPISSTLGY
jgi:phosphatidylinositol glycan class S